MRIIVSLGQRLQTRKASRLPAQPPLRNPQSQDRYQIEAHRRYRQNYYRATLLLARVDLAL